MLMTGYYVVESLKSRVSKVYMDISRNYSANIGKLYIERILHGIETKIITASRELGHTDLSNEAVKDDISRTALAILNNSPELDAVVMADKDGHFVRVPDNNYQDLFPNGKIKDREWFIHDANSATHIRFTEPHNDSFTGISTVTVSTPLINALGRFNGILAFDINLSQISRNMEKMSPPIEGHIVLLSSSGQVIADDMIDNVWQPDNIEQIYPLLKKNSGTYYDDVSKSWFFSYQFEGPRWTLIYSVSDSNLKQQVWDDTQEVLYGFITFMVVLLTFGFFLKYHWEKKLVSIIGHIKTGTPQGYDNLEYFLSEEINRTKHREKTLTDESQRDVLTGALNRRALELALDKKIAKQEHFSFSLLDIDNFKTINDRFGHVVGDDVLKFISFTCRNLLEGYGCQLYRYGGEEFAILFNRMNAEQAFHVLEKCHAALRDREWREDGLQVTFSAGLARWQGQEKQVLVEHVDSLLYQAKQAGKNQTVMTS